MSAYKSFAIGPCPRCGDELKNTGKWAHDLVCSKIPPGKELQKFVTLYPTFSMLEFDYYFAVSSGRIREYLIKSGWSERDIVTRKLFTRKQLKDLDFRIPTYRGSGNRFKARCLRCELLLFAENIPGRFCRYCKKEGVMPTFAQERINVLHRAVEADYMEVRQGGLAFGWDGTMNTYFAFILPKTNTGIPVWSIGNAPFQMVTLKKFSKILSGMGIDEYEEVIKRAEKFKRIATRLFAKRIEKYISSSSRIEVR